MNILKEMFEKEYGVKLSGNKRIGLGPEYLEWLEKYTESLRVCIDEIEILYNEGRELKILLKKCYDCFNTCEQDGFDNGVFTSEIMTEIKDKIK